MEKLDLFLLTFVCSSYGLVNQTNNKIHIHSGRRTCNEQKIHEKRINGRKMRVHS